jgi:hypothetical protein
VISEPPGVDRWDDGVIERLGVRRVADPSVPSATRRDMEIRGETSAGIDGLVAVFLAE